MTTALMFVLVLNGGLYLGTILYTAITWDPKDRIGFSGKQGAPRPGA